MKNGHMLVILGMSLTLSLFLSGCGKMTLNTAVDLHRDGGGTFKFKMEATGMLAGVVTGENDEMDLNQWKRIPGGVVREYDDGDSHIAEVRVNFKSPAEAKRLLRRTGYTLDIGRWSNLLYTYHKVEFAYPDEMDYGNFKKELIDSEEVKNEFFSPADLEQALNSMMLFQHTVKMPGKIISTNAPVIKGEKHDTASWTVRLRQLSKGRRFTVQSRTWNWPGILFLGGGVVLILGLFWMMLRRRGKRRNLFSEESPFPSTEV